MVSALFLLLICQVELFQADNVLFFADHLYSTGEHAAALQEYLRYRFLNGVLTDTIHEKMIDCYLRTGQHTIALQETDMLTDSNRINYLKGFIYYTIQDFDSSRIYLEQFGIPYTKDVQTLLGLGYAQEFRFDDAAVFFDLPGTIPNHKSPVLGGALAIFPGGGHFYCGRIGDGLFSCAIVSLSAGLAYYYHTKEENTKFSFALGATILLYAGNVYGGINAVRNYNYYNDNSFRRAIYESHEFVDPFSY